MNPVNLAILDRDGVINRDSDEYIKSPEEWHPIPGSLDAIARLNRAGIRVVVASNQSGLRRKLFTIETLNAIHSRMSRELAALGGRVDAIFFCPCVPKDDCSCYKPKPGMLHAISDRWRMRLDGVPVIGDSLRDVEAARAAGARPILVRTGNGRATLDAHPHLKVEVHEDLAAAATALTTPSAG